MSHAQYNHLGVYCDPYTTSSVFLIIIFHLPDTEGGATVGPKVVRPKGMCKGKVR